MRFATTVPTIVFHLSFASTMFSQQLEIHYINVGWGSSVFVKGPDGTTVLLEAGENGMGSARVIPYLTSIGVLPASGLDYTIAGHQHCDHLGGMDEIVNGGYTVRNRNYYNGSTYGGTSATGCPGRWRTAAGLTPAGVPVVMSVGTMIPLGSGATLTSVACNGDIIGGGHVAVSNENDRSIAVLIQYGGFDYLWASDMGGGNVDATCTNRSTTQTDVETSVIEAISPGGAHPMITSGGIDVLNVNHHGSESSTNKNWMNLSRPAVAVIPTGAGQSVDWHLPRKDVVENVLHAEASCITVPEAFVLQTEEGSPTGSQTSFAGYCVGNIKVVTDGGSTFTVSADGMVSQGPNELTASGLPRTFPIDDGAPPPTVTPLILSGVQVNVGADNVARVSWTTDRNATSTVEYGTTLTYTSTVADPTLVASHLLALSNLASGMIYHYRVRSQDGAGNEAMTGDLTFSTTGSQTYPVHAIAVTRGSLETGGLPQLATDDQHYLAVKSTASEQIRYSEWYATVTLSGAFSSVSKLACTYNGKYSRGGITQRVYLYNWTTSRWNQMGTALTVGQADQTVFVERLNPGVYISSTGEVRFRIRGEKDDNRSFKCLGDFVKLEASYGGGL